LFFDGYHARSIHSPKPPVIQIGAVGNALGKPHTNRAMEVLHSQKLLEKEFEKDGIPIIWSFLVGTGPAINEELADENIDFGHYGNICGVVGKARGIRTRALAMGGRGLNIYIGVPPGDRTTRALGDLRGRRIGLLRETYLHLMFEKLLSRLGLTEDDFNIYNLGFAEGNVALMSGQIDAYVDIYNGINLHDGRRIRTIFDSREEADDFKGSAVLVGREAFIRRYPDITKRLVKAYVRAAHWASLEENRDEYLRMNSLTGISRPSLKFDYEGISLRWRNNPLLDDFFFRSYGETVDFSKRRGWIPEGFDVQKWADRSFLGDAVKDLGLEHFWVDQDGKTARHRPAALAGRVGV